MIYEKDGVQMDVNGIAERAFVRNGWKPVGKAEKAAPVVEEATGAVVSEEKEAPKEIKPLRSNLKSKSTTARK